MTTAEQQEKAGAYQTSRKIASECTQDELLKIIAIIQAMTFKGQRLHPDDCQCRCRAYKEEFADRLQRESISDQLGYDS
jgi:hypothetical protein